MTSFKRTHEGPTRGKINIYSSPHELFLKYSESDIFEIQKCSVNFRNQTLIILTSSISVIHFVLFT